jgi:hypothetical protein
MNKWRFKLIALSLYLRSGKIPIIYNDVICLRKRRQRSLSKLYPCPLIHCTNFCIFFYIIYSSSQNIEAWERTAKFRLHRCCQQNRLPSSVWLYKVIPAVKHELLLLYSFGNILWRRHFAFPCLRSLNILGSKCSFKTWVSQKVFQTKATFTL